MKDTIRLNQSLAASNKSYWSWISLTFSSFYFLPLAFGLQPVSLVIVVGALVTYGAFLWLYLKASKTQADRVTPLLLTMLMVCFVGTAFTAGTQALFGYASFIFGFSFVFKTAIKGLLLVVATILLSAWWFDFLAMFFLAPSLIISLGLFFFGQAERKDRKHQLEQQRSAEKIEQLATIAERERIARDLHDVIGHALSSIALKAELAEKLISANKTERAALEVNEVAQLSRTVLAEVREAVSGLKQKKLSYHLTQLVEQLEQGGFAVDVQQRLNNMPALVETQLTLMLTEAVTNILRHSTGNQVSIKIVVDNGYRLTIKDNGEVKHVAWGNGLNGIQERCLELGGEMVVNTDNGVELAIFLPEQLAQQNTVQRGICHD